MCLILLAYNVHPRYRLVLAANRDEFYDRPTASAAFWKESPHLLAGKDLAHGGTWLGITEKGRFAALTNYRDPASRLKGAPSRGKLVSRFLETNEPLEEYLKVLEHEGSAYNGFNLLFGAVDRLYCHSNRTEQTTRLDSGIYGLCNHLLDTRWWKVTRGKGALAQLIAGGDGLSTGTLLTLLADSMPAPDELLPDTGIGMELERLVSPIFISSPSYGTRSSTVLLVDKGNYVTLVERTFTGQTGQPRTVEHRFRIFPHGVSSDSQNGISLSL